MWKKSLFAQQNKVQRGSLLFCLARMVVFSSVKEWESAQVEQS